MLVEEHIPIYVVPTLDPAGFVDPQAVRVKNVS